MNGMLSKKVWGNHPTQGRPGHDAHRPIREPRANAVHLGRVCVGGGGGSSYFQMPTRITNSYIHERHCVKHSRGREIVVPKPPMMLTWVCMQIRRGEEGNRWMKKRV